MKLPLSEERSPHMDSSIGHTICPPLGLVFFFYSFILSNHIDDLDRG